MAVTQLATSTDVAAVLGRSLTAEETAKVGAVLDKASELFRHRSGQQFTTGTSTVRVRNRVGVVTLPQRPVTAVTSVVDDDGVAVTYEFDDRFQISVTSTEKFVTVTYSHGGTVPDLVRLTVAEIAKKVLMISPDAAAGMSSSMHTTGPFTDQESYATWAQGGQTMLAPSDDQIALSYRIPMAGPISNA